MRHGTIHAYIRGKCRCESCREAMREYKRDYRRRKAITDPEYEERRNRKKRRWHIERQYGITFAEYEALIIAQGGRCAICEDNPPMLVMDHCHVTGANRGLLCQRCNTALGAFGDNTEGLARAMRYLERK